MKIKGVMILVSVVFVIASLVVFWRVGFNFGVDFKGGIKLVYQFSEPVGDGRIREILEPLGLGDIQVVQFGKESEKSYLIKVKQVENRDISQEIRQNLASGFASANPVLLSEENVGAKVGADLRRRGLFAIILSWVLMLVYIGWRFDFLFAPGAVLSLVHDVIISLGFFVFFGKEFNLPILAGVLTLIGYSINDTIVIYDRVRENLRKIPASVPLSDLINISVNETLSRTIVTSLTVFFAMLVLFFFGGGVVHDFAFYMLVGVVVGTYSTVFIASPVYLALTRVFPHKGLVRNIGKR